MSQTPHIGIVSPSLDPESRSAVIAGLCLDKLTQRGVRTNLIDLRSIIWPGLTTTRSTKQLNTLNFTAQ